MKFILIYLYLKKEDNLTIFYNTVALLSLQPYTKHTSNTLFSYGLEQWFWAFLAQIVRIAVYRRPKDIFTISF